MAYGQRLEDLLQLTQAGAVDPMQAVQTMWGMQDQRRANRQERRDSRLDALMAQQEAQQGALDDLSTLGFEEAQKGTPMSTLLSLVNAQTGGGFETGRELKSVIPGLEGLYREGVSTVNPMLDAEDQNALLSSVGQALQQGKDQASIYRDIHAQVSSAYPDQYASLAPEVDKLIEAAMKRNQGF